VQNACRPARDFRLRSEPTSTDEEGNPYWERRAKGAALALDQLAHLAREGGRGQSLPEGVRLVVPLPRDEQPLGKASG